MYLALALAYDGAVATPKDKPRLFMPLRPDVNLIHEPPVPPGRHPAFVYVRGLSSPRSREAMARALGRIAELFKLRIEELDWSRLTYNHVWSIREELGKRYSPATVNQSLSALRGVLRIAHPDRNQLYRAAVGVPLVPTGPPPAAGTPSKRQIARLLKEAGRDRSPKGLRDRALLAVVAGGGLKRSEVVGLRLADFDPRTGKLKVGDRTISLSEGEKQSLRAWIAYRGRAHGALFVPINKAGRLTRRQMSGQAVAAVVGERAAEAGLGHLGPEDLRRAYLAAQA